MSAPPLRLPANHSLCCFYKEFTGIHLKKKHRLLHFPGAPEEKPLQLRNDAWELLPSNELLPVQGDGNRQLQEAAAVSLDRVNILLREEPHPLEAIPFLRLQKPCEARIVIYDNFGFSCLEGDVSLVFQTSIELRVFNRIRHNLDTLYMLSPLSKEQRDRANAAIGVNDYLFTS
jgi:hypothetical protein